MKIIILSILILTIKVDVLAQIDTTRKEFYPLQIGNLWQYRNEDNFLFTAKIIADTILEGNKYFMFDSAGLRTHGRFMRVDSLMRVQIRRGAPTAGDSCGGNTPYEESIYHLFEPDSSIWEICEHFSEIPGSIALMRYNGMTQMNIYGQLREVLIYDFGGTHPGEDTIWISGALIAKGIGILIEDFYEFSYSILQGAIIDGVQYGTIVSVDEIPETIPESIVLYQNYPNPFNPSTNIRFDLSKQTKVNYR